MASLTKRQPAASDVSGIQWVIDSIWGRLLTTKRNPATMLINEARYQINPTACRANPGTYAFWLGYDPTMLIKLDPAVLCRCKTKKQLRELLEVEYAIARTAGGEEVQV